MNVEIFPISNMTSGQRSAGVAVDRANREKDDFYPTPPRATLALLGVENFFGPVWEPACGDGAISKVLEAAGYQVVSTDLVDRGYGTSRVDFLMEHMLAAPNIVTNPPFKMADQFMEHAWRLGVFKMAMLMRLNALAPRRYSEFHQKHLARIWVFQRRLQMQRGGEAVAGSSMLEFAWFIWERGHSGPAAAGWLP